MAGPPILVPFKGNMILGMPPPIVFVRLEISQPPLDHVFLPPGHHRQVRHEETAVFEPLIAGFE